MKSRALESVVGVIKAEIDHLEYELDCGIAGSWLGDEIHPSEREDMIDMLANLREWLSGVER